jgi:diguanylate cyclase (GGDEF)-like protein
MAEFPREGSAPLVLVANDQEWSARSLESVLGPQGYAVVRAYSGRQALELARRTNPDLVLIDAGMPDIGGIEFCRRVADDPEFQRSTPIIITTAGAASRADRLAAYGAGAWEFLSLPLDTEALLLKLAVLVRAKREIDRSRQDSLLDATTGLYNVRGLTRRAQEIGSEAARRKSPISCLVIAPVPANRQELNSADELEPRVAERLGEVCRRTVRASDAVGRLGVAEFAIVAPDTGRQGIEHLADRLRQAIEGSQFGEGTEEQRYKVRAGYSSVQDFSTSSVDAVEVLLRAATALRHVRTSPAPLPASAFEDLPSRLTP